MKPGPYIYALYDQAGRMRYVGKTDNPRVRLASHLRAAVTKDTALYRWIRNGGRPTMVILEANCADWRASERRHIAEARDRDEPLLNMTKGGDQPRVTLGQLRKNYEKLQSAMQAPVAYVNREVLRRLGKESREMLHLGNEMLACRLANCVVELRKKIDEDPVAMAGIFTGDSFWWDRLQLSDKLEVTTSDAG